MTASEATPKRHTTVRLPRCQSRREDRRGSHRCCERCSRSSSRIRHSIATLGRTELWELSATQQLEAELRQVYEDKKQLRDELAAMQLAAEEGRGMDAARQREHVVDAQSVLTVS